MECHHCSFITLKKRQLIQHLQTEHPIMYQCQFCERYKTINYRTCKKHETFCKKNNLNLAMTGNPCKFTCLEKDHINNNLKRKHQKVYHCACCKSYTSNILGNFKKHVLRCKKKKKCSYCKFTSKDTKEMKRHMYQSKHSSILCSECGKQFLSTYYYTQHKHVCIKHTNKSEIEIALKGKFKIFKFSKFSSSFDFRKVFLLEMKDTITHYISTEANSSLGVKWYICVQVSMYKINSDGEETWIFPVFSTSLEIAYPYNEPMVSLSDSFNILNEKIDLFTSLGSGWIFNEVLRIDLHIAQHNPLSGASWLPTPIIFTHKKVCDAVLNIENKNDNFCFKYCILAAIFDLKDVNVETYNNLKHNLDFTHLNFPMEVKQIQIFERRNPKISVSIFGFENKDIFPLHISNSREFDHHIDLLLITSGEVSHFLLISNKNQIFKHVLFPTLKYPILICDYCLNKFRYDSSYTKHVENCKNKCPQVTRFPIEPKNILKWTSYNKKIKQPIAIYSDFETMNIGGQLTATSYVYVIVDDTQTPLELREYRAEEGVISHFLRSIISDVKAFENSRIEHKNITWTPEDRKRYLESTHCHICEEPFDTSITDFTQPKARVADHYHIEFPHTKPTEDNKPGRLRGAAHRDCNEKFHRKFRVPVVFHNLKNFDSHLIIQNIAPFVENPRDFNCIPQTIEKYLSFSFRNIDFIDSMHFLNASLDTLSQTLNPNEMRIMKNYFPDEKTFNLLTRKGIFPYEYITSYEKLEETKLPSKKHFYNTLKKCDITDEDYTHAQLVWKTLRCNTLGDYQDVYNKCDTLLLADVFENFRSSMLNYYGQDPILFVSLPSFVWSSMLKMTKIQLELVSNPDIYLMIEEGVRGGVSVIPTRYAEAVNDESAILYIDCVNLYGKALSDYLPYKDFRFVDVGKFDEVLSTSNVSEVGFICEVDMYVPKELHDYMNDFPLAPTKTKIEAEKLSTYQIKILKTLNMKYKPTEKLITSLEPKSKYIIHYKNLQFYIKLGMVITKVHRILQFKQAPWMKPFIDFNTEKRAHAKSKFEENMFKLCSNAAYGRTLLNKRRYKNFKLLTDEETAASYIRKPSFKQFSIFNKDLVGILYTKTSVLLDSPIYAGMVTLEISKLIMYQYYYNVLKNKFKENMILCMSDTDSLLLHIRTPHLYCDLIDISDTLDTSNYPLNHYLYSEENKKVLGKFKDESPANPITKFVGLKAKMYSFQTKHNKNKSVGKGIPSSSLKDISFPIYKNSLFNENITRVEFETIESKNHKLRMKKIKKIALCPFDDKRYLLPDKVHTLAYGHYKIEEGN